MAEAPDGEEFPIYTSEILPHEISYGNYRVKKISSEIIAKFTRGWVYYFQTSIDPEPLLFTSVEHLVQEYHLHQQAYGAGLSVPKPKGLFRVPMQSFHQMLQKKQLIPAFLMQYIAGTPLGRLSPETCSYAHKLREEKLEKARELGFKPRDCYHFGNALYHPLEEKVYLIDLELWQKD